MPNNISAKIKNKSQLHKQLIQSLQDFIGGRQNHAG